jgi:hypothetical protein
MSLVGSRDFKRLGAAIIAVIVAASCAVAQEAVAPIRPDTASSDRTGTDAGATGATPAQPQRTSTPLLFPRGSAKARNRGERDAATTLTPQPGDAIRLPDKDGQPVWTVYGARFEQFRESLKSKNTAEHNEPDYSISSVSLTGSCDDERAQLTAKIEIQVERDGIWLTVPIDMQEGFIALPGMRQTGAGEFRAVVPVDRMAPHSVLLRGKGLHELSVPLVVLIRRQLNQRHLQLTIPPAAGSQLTLRVPKEHCQVKPIEGTHVYSSAIPQGTRIEAYGIRGQFDLAWDVPINEPQARMVFDVASKCTLGMEGDRVQLHVVQAIDAKQGTVASVRVRMPAGFRSIAGQQKDVPDARKYTATDVDASGFIKVALKPATNGRAELSWDLEGPHQAGSPLVVRGFDVEGARSEIGDVSLIPAEGFHFEFRNGENVRRINGLGAGLAESTYSFSQPFRLELGLEEIRPQFSVEPSLFLLLSEQRAELTGQFRVQIHQGAVRAIAFQWPDWKKQGWTIDDVSENADLVENNPKDPAEHSSLRFRLSGRLGSDFMLTFRALRSIPRQGTTFRLTLPVIDGSVRPASALVVADAENVKSSLDPLAETAVRPIGPERREALNVPESLRGLHQVALRVDSAVQAFDASVAVQKQQIETESTAQVEVQEGRLQVTQRISYHVSYERLAEGVFVLPKELRRGDVQFHVDRSDSDFEAIPTWTPGDADSGDVARIAFEPRRIGSFDVFARYFVPLAEPAPNEASTEVSVPLLRSRDAAFKAMRVELRARDDTEVEVTDEAWSPQIPQISADKGSTHAWTVAGDRTSIPLRLLRISSVAAPRVKIAKALLRSIVDVTGVVQTAALYRIQGPAASVVLTLPSHSTDPKFSLDGVELKPERIREARPDSREFRLDIGSLSPNPERVLAVEYRDPNGSPCGFVALHRLQAPSFPDSTSIGSLIWEVTFPYEQFLFLDPSGFSPEFRWQRQSVFWSRGPTPLAADAGGWLGTTFRPVGDDGNTYAFSRFGGVPTILVGSMAQSFVIFVGAGLSLLAAFVLLKLPAARTPLTLFLFAFAVAVVYLWSAEAVRLLLQPAFFGFLLAVGAAALDARIQRRRAPFLLASPSAADFVATATSPSSIERALVLTSDPEALTISRPGSQSGQQPVSASDRGSGS